MIVAIGRTLPVSSRAYSVTEPAPVPEVLLETNTLPGGRTASIVSEVRRGRHCAGQTGSGKGTGDKTTTPDEDS